MEFDSRLSVGNVHEYDIDYHGDKSNVTVISYYDIIRDFTYSSKGEALTWYMPFDWNMERLEKDQNILVHNEIRVPKEWFNNVEDRMVTDNVSAAIGRVNDNRLEGKSFAVDPYSSQDSVTFHYILDKSYLINLAQNQSVNFNNTISKAGVNFNNTISKAGDNNITDSSGHMKFELGGF